ncbi:RNA methyltransferase [Thermogymnomonas acidicola]|uniref:RNA methyltransferase n=1 Tax=Thermogymnomonas acidicola TaxID=399579 RepID=A0AA37BSU4_9ARCH|nr:METTL5 family protein [Thermogymnomonas acidicola]GGM77768.1 RNA methyltransferase [Thermogymnomonas acidicola]
MARSLKSIEIELQNRLPRIGLDVSLEQYITDPGLVSRIVFLAYSNGHIEGKSVVDLGSGYGHFAYASRLMGSARTTAVEIDSRLIRATERTLREAGIEVLNMDVRDLQGHWDTAIMNPPFGSVNPGADRPFMQKAVEVADYIYAVHNSKSAEFTDRFYSSHGTVISRHLLQITVPRMYRHHREEKAYVRSILYCVRVSR